MDNQAKDYRDQGILLMNESNFKEAIKCLKKALEYEENAEILIDLGNAYVGDAEYDRAIDTFSKALRYEPDNGKIYFKIGSAYLLQERLRKMDKS